MLQCAHVFVFVLVLVDFHFYNLDDATKEICGKSKREKCVSRLISLQVCSCCSVQKIIIFQIIAILPCGLPKN